MIVEQQITRDLRIDNRERRHHHDETEDGEASVKPHLTERRYGHELRLHTGRESIATQRGQSMLTRLLYER